MHLYCQNCRNKITITEDEGTLEGQLITCNLCKEEFIYHTRTFFLESRLTELDKDLYKKESHIYDQNNLYNEKIKSLELELINKKKELEKQNLLEQKITDFENRVTETEKLASHQADLETKIFELEKKVKKTSEDILDKNASFEKKANYLEMKASTIKKKTDDKKSIAVNESRDEVVNFRAYEKKNVMETVKKSFFWTSKEKK